VVRPRKSVIVTPSLMPTPSLWRANSAADVASLWISSTATSTRNRSLFIEFSPFAGALLHPCARRLDTALFTGFPRRVPYAFCERSARCRLDQGEQVIIFGLPAVPNDLPECPVRHRHH